MFGGVFVIVKAAVCVSLLLFFIINVLNVYFGLSDVVIFGFLFCFCFKNFLYFFILLGRIIFKFKWGEKRFFKVFRIKIEYLLIIIFLWKFVNVCRIRVLLLLKYIGMSDLNQVLYDILVGFGFNFFLMIFFIFFYILFIL